MLSAARAQGMPMMVTAMITAAISHPAAIHRPPHAIHSRLSRREKSDIRWSSRHSDNPSGPNQDGYWKGRLPARRTGVSDGCASVAVERGAPSDIGLRPRLAGAECDHRLGVGRAAGDQPLALQP